MGWLWVGSYYYYSRTGLTLWLTFKGSSAGYRQELTLWLTFKGSSAGYRQEHYREMATIRKPQSAGLTIK